MSPHVKELGVADSCLRPTIFLNLKATVTQFSQSARFALAVCRFDQVAAGGQQKQKELFLS
jgi:hypothetical protein